MNGAVIIRPVKGCDEFAQRAKIHLYFAQHHPISERDIICVAYWQHYCSVYVPDLQNHSYFNRLSRTYTQAHSPCLYVPFFLFLSVCRSFACSDTTKSTVDCKMM